MLAAGQGQRAGKYACADDCSLHGSHAPSSQHHKALGAAHKKGRPKAAFADTATASRQLRDQKV
jgi:hypothetical protein